MARLRAGDEDAFAELVERHAPSMLRVAAFELRGAALAEDAVQDAWIRVLRSLDGFEGRCSLRTWIFTILRNSVRSRAAGERRYLPCADLDGEADGSPAVPASRFFPVEHPRWAGMWSTRVDGWHAIPDERLLDGEVRERLRGVLDALPRRQALVFVLRDVEGWRGGEVCELLGLSPENQRVLLHRARSRVRAAMEAYLTNGNG